MDTVTISIPCERALNYIINKLGEPKKRCNLGELYKYRCHKKDDEGRQLSVKWMPTGGLKTQSYGKLDVHLKEHSNWLDFQAWLKKYTGPHHTAVMEGRITRLDIRVFLDIEPETFFSKVIISGKKIRSTITSNGETLYGGSNKSSSQTKAYRDEEGVAVEISYKKSSVPVGSFNELHKIIDLYPFSNLAFFDIDITKQIRPEDLKIFSDFSKKCQHAYVSSAIHSMGQNGISKKKLKSFLRPIMKELVPSAWKHTAATFFELNSNIQMDQLNLKQFADRHGRPSKIVYGNFCDSCEQGAADIPLNQEELFGTPLFSSISTIERVQL